MSSFEDAYPHLVSTPTSIRSTLDTEDTRNVHTLIFVTSAIFKRSFKCAFSDCNARILSSNNVSLPSSFARFKGAAALLKKGRYSEWFMASNLALTRTERRLPVELDQLLVRQPR